MTPTDTREVRILSCRPAQEVIVEVMPADTASAVLEKAGLNASYHILLRPGEQEDFAPEDSVWASVPEHGGTLHVVPLPIVC